MKYKQPITKQAEALDAVRAYFRVNRASGSAIAFHPLRDAHGEPDWVSLTNRVLEGFNSSSLFEKSIDTNYIEEDILLKTVEFSYKDQYNTGERK